jgi:hypothetical protein
VPQARARCSDVAFRGYIAELPPGVGPAAFDGPAAPTHVLELVLSDSEARARMEGLRADHVTGAVYSRSDLTPGPHQVGSVRPRLLSCAPHLSGRGT